MWTRVIYTTITPMAVLIIYDGWEQLRSWNVVTVIVGPLLAILVVALPLLVRAYDHLWLITACRSWANLAPDSEPALR